MVGGRVALAVLDAVILGLIGWLAITAVGRWGALVPFWIVLTSTEVVWRLVRLRAELGSLALLLVALWAAGRGRYRWLGVVAVLYALSYTAIHAFVGLFLMLFLVELWAERRPPWRLAFYPVLGAVVGLVVHPHFPRNLALWWYQTVVFFREKGALDIGTELRPNFTDVTLMVNLGWLLGLVVLWRSADRRAEPGGGGPEWARMARAFGLAALAFGVLYLLMSRFVIYAIPFTTLWLLCEIRRRGWTLGSSTRLPVRGRVPLIAAGLVCLLVGLPVARAELGRFRKRTSAGPDEVRIRDREAMAAALPDGAQVLAPWRSTPLYMFWAPQGRYMNVLDPVFLAGDDPDLHAAQEAIFAGEEPDVPLVAAFDLDSDYLALSAATANRTLLARLRADPRVETVHRQINALFRFVPAPEGSFVLGWKVAPESESRSDDFASWPDNPAMPPGRARELEAFVDARRVRDGCVRFVRRFDVAESRSSLYELAPFGPTEWRVDGRVVAASRAEMRAVLGQGLLVPLELAAGRHEFSVRTCPTREGAPSGFYLVRRR